MNEVDEFRRALKEMAQWHEDEAEKITGMLRHNFNVELRFLRDQHLRFAKTAQQALRIYA